MKWIQIIRLINLFTTIAMMCWNNSHDIILYMNIEDLLNPETPPVSTPDQPEENQGNTSDPGGTNNDDGNDDQSNDSNNLSDSDSEIEDPVCDCCGIHRRHGNCTCNHEVAFIEGDSEIPTTPSEPLPTELGRRCCNDAEAPVHVSCNNCGCVFCDFDCAHEHATLHAPASPPVAPSPSTDSGFDES